MRRIEHETQEHLRAHVETGHPLAGCVFQGLDLRAWTEVLTGQSLKGCLFLGCRLEPEALARAQEDRALVFPLLPGLPYHPYRGYLYRVEELFAGYEPGGSYEDSLDGKIYRHFLETGGPRPGSIRETLARRLHDHAITDALDDVIAGRRTVAVMGGHALGRDEAVYARIARIGRSLARRGALVATGGGPGAMEAAHLGSLAAAEDDEFLDRALAVLAKAPSYKPREAWLDTALEVRAMCRAPRPEAPAGLGIPTWLYGHEPPNLFADEIAKYFANSVREDGLLAIATGGVIFAPGSAGTIQEIFQDAAQNHYLTAGIASPMIFFGHRYWTETKPVYPLLSQLAEGREYAEHLTITDEEDAVIEQLLAFDPHRPDPL